MRAESHPWVVSYDDVPDIRALYHGAATIAYGIRYSAHQRYQGREVMFFSPSVRIPEIRDPTALNTRELARLELQPAT